MDLDMVLISPEGQDERELGVLPELFAAGLQRYHLRKPAWTAERMAAWVRAVPEAFRGRVVPHSHHELVERFGLGGSHGPDDPASLPQANAPHRLTSRSCHDLDTLDEALGRFDSVFFGPVFPSISKPGRLPRADLSRGALVTLLGREDVERRRTRILALGGVTAEKVAECRAMGFDGVAVLGAVWAPGPRDGVVAAFRAILAACQRERRDAPAAGGGGGRGGCALPWLMCLTLDGIGISHEEQCRRLCAGGARWVQVRMKDAGEAERLRVGRECVRVCREFGARCVINDRVDVAVAVGADGAHVGREDGDWRAARAALGPEAILGGTVNDEQDAARALEAGCLDYVGVGPFRFTSTKRKLSPVVGVDGIRRLVRAAGSLPAWAIGGVTEHDLDALAQTGAAGVAVSSALYRNGAIEENVAAFLRSGFARKPGAAGAAAGLAGAGDAANLALAKGLSAGVGDPGYRAERWAAGVAPEAEISK